MTNDENEVPTDSRGQLTIELLIDLFKHWDNIHMSKENLFIPVSIAIVPSVILAWDALSADTIAIAWLASGSLYLYHLLVLRRFGFLQDRIFNRIIEEYPDFRDIVQYPPRMLGIQMLGVRSLRVALFIALNLIWLGLLFVKRGVLGTP